MTAPPARIPKDIRTPPPTRCLLQNREIQIAINNPKTSDGTITIEAFTNVRSTRRKLQIKSVPATRIIDKQMICHFSLTFGRLIRFSRVNFLFLLFLPKDVAFMTPYGKVLTKAGKV